MTYPSTKDSNFREKLRSKQEFLEIVEERTVEQKIIGLKAHQTFVSRFISPATPYTHILLFHATGSGKTWSIASIVDKFKTCKKPALILLQGETAVSAFKANFTEWYRAYFQYFDKTSLQIKEYVEEYLKKYVVIQTYIQFAKRVNAMDVEKISELYSNRVIVIDEVHKVNARAHIQEKVHKATNLAVAKLLANIHNFRVVISTATPMVDSKDQILSIINMVLPPGEQITEATLNDTELRRAIRGKVSYFKSEEEDKPNILHYGTSMNKRDKHIFIQMLGLQKQCYDTLRNEIQSNTLYMKDIYTSLCVLPIVDDFGRVIKVAYTSDDLPSDYFQEVSWERTVHYRFGHVNVRRWFEKEMVAFLEDPSKSRISEFSCKYTFLLKQLLCDYSRQEKFFVFCQQVSTFGITTLSSLLTVAGFEFYDGSIPIEKMDIKPRFIILSGKSPNVVTRGDENMTLSDVFNHPLNKHGEYIKILIVSDVGSESLTLKCVRQVYVLTPFWNTSKITQVVARAVRIRSHIDLPPSQRYVRVFKILAVSIASSSLSQAVISPLTDISNVNFPEACDVVETDKENIDVRQQIVASSKQLDILAVEELLQQEAVDRFLYEPAEMDKVDKSTVARHYAHLPRKTLMNVIKRELLQSGSIVIDRYCKHLGINPDSFLRTLKYLYQECVSIIKDNCIYTINISANTIYLEPILGKKECTLTIDQKFLNTKPSTSYSSIHREELIETLKSLDKSNSFIEIRRALESGKVDVITLTEEGIVHELHHIRAWCRSGWITYEGEYYTMVHHTMKSISEYDSSADPEPSRIRDFVYTLTSGKWVKVLQPRSEVLEALCKNYINVKYEKGRYIFGFYKLSDKKLRIRDSSNDHVNNRRKVNRGRYVYNFNNTKDIQRSLLLFVAMELTEEQCVDVIGVGPVPITEQELRHLSDLVNLPSQAIPRLMRSDILRRVCSRIRCIKRKEGIELLTEVCYKNALYTVVV